MAVAARPPAAAADSTRGLKAALVAFVAVAVVSLGLLIWLYTGQEQLNQKIEAAQNQMQAAADKERENRAALEALAVQVVGKQTSDPAEITAELDTATTAVFGREGTRPGEAQEKLIAEAGIKRNDPLVTTLQALQSSLAAQIEKVEAAQADFQKLSEELEARTAQMQAVQQQFTAEADRIKTDLAQLEEQVMANRDAWDQSLARLREQSQAEGERASEQLTAERQQRQNLEKQLAQQKDRVDELVATLATFRPSADETSLLQIADGSVVQTVPGERIVYISLGSQDHIKPGMTFAVYSRTRGIPPDGEGKATLKVANVFDVTSECQITTSKAGDPIVTGDIVANPVYDRNRQYNFVVAGDFDLDYDGKIDDVDGEQVRRMIQAWGGNLQRTVDTRADFVVLGAAPKAVEGAADAGSHAEALQRFNDIKQEAKALGVPVLTRSQFLHFVGFGIPRNAEDEPV